MSALAGTIIVGGDCSLGEAILSANSDLDLFGCQGAGGDDRLILDEEAMLTRPDEASSSELFGHHAALPDVTSTITLEAGKAFRVVRDPSLPCEPYQEVVGFRLLNVVGGDLTLRGLTLENGCAYRGAGVLVVGGAQGASSMLTLEATTMRSNTARGDDEDDPDETDPLTIEAQGGAIYVADGGSIARVTGSRFVGNRALSSSICLPPPTYGSVEGAGGAISVATGGSIGLIEASVFEGNTAGGGHCLSPEGGAGYGGAVAVDQGGLLGEVADSRFSNNQALGGVGQSGGASFGGAIAAKSGPAIKIRDSVFEANEARGGPHDGYSGGPASGGALWLQRFTEIADLVVNENLAQGAGGSITRGGEATGGGLALVDGTLRNVQVRGNRALAGHPGDGRAAAFGGGLAVSGWTEAERMTLTGNLVMGGSDQGSASGGGAYVSAAGSRWSTVTIAGNHAEGAPPPWSPEGPGGPAFGGGLAAIDNLELIASTIVDNTAEVGEGTLDWSVVQGGGVWTQDGFEISSSIVVDNVIVDFDDQSLADDCYGIATVSGGANLFETAGNCSVDAPGDQVGVDPALEPLAPRGCTELLPNGSCLPVHGFGASSPAVDQGSCPPDADVDARGLPRPWDELDVANYDDGCDVGAFEFRDVDGDGEDDGVLLEILFGDAFESGDTTGWDSSS